MDKSDWDTVEVERNICVKKSTAILLKTRFCSPDPTQHKVEPQEKLQVLFFNIVCGVRLRGRAGEVVFTSGVCPKASKVQTCTFVHECSYNADHI